MPRAAQEAPARLEPAPRLRAVPTEPEQPVHGVEPVRHDSRLPDYQLVHFRLEALERLSVLRERNALTPQEYESEKGLVLRLQADELEIVQDSILPRRGPSLLGRMFGWKLILSGLVAGFGFVALTAPQELASLVERLSHLVA